MGVLDTVYRLLGTASDIFQIGNEGPNLKNVGGVLEVRNEDDDAYAVLRVADAVADDDVVTKRALDLATGGTAGTTIFTTEGGLVYTTTGDVVVKVSS